MSLTMQLVFVAVVLAAVKGEDDDMMRKCHMLHHPKNFECCEDGGFFKNFPAIDECMKDLPKGPKPDGPRPGGRPPGPPPCDIEICVAKKLGFGLDDGSVDKNALKELISKELASQPDLLEMMDQNCLKGDVSKIGPPDMCENKKIMHCFQMQYYKHCNKWSSTDKCTEVKSLVDVCSNPSA